jgi:apolipoprotein N-acyltransferase
LTLGRAVGLSVAGLMVLVGAVWFGQGNGWIGGSSMTGEDFWAYAGALTAGLGVALAIVVVQNARRKDG